MFGLKSVVVGATTMCLPLGRQSQVMGFHVPQIVPVPVQQRPVSRAVETAPPMKWHQDTATCFRPFEVKTLCSLNGKDDELKGSQRQGKPNQAKIHQQKNAKKSAVKVQPLSFMKELASQQNPEFHAEEIGRFKIKTPSYLNLSEQKPSEEQSMYISSFGLFHSHISKIDHIRDGVQSPESVQSKTLTRKLVWPNDITEVPRSVLNQDNMIAVGDGFLLPTKNNGGLYFVDATTGKTTPVLKKKPGWFYHRAAFHDLNGDGKLDLITARTKKLFLGQAKSELVWATAPQDPTQYPWPETIIGEGPDFLFQVTDLNGDGDIDVLASEFSNEQLSLFTFSKGAWNRQVLGQGAGPLFDLEVVDLNNDGQLDILFTNHVGDSRAGAFAMTRNKKTQEWEQKILVEGIETRNKAPGNASPGAAIPFQRDARLKQKPSILLSGDGSGCAYVLNPKSEDPQDWSYSVDVVLDEGKSMIGSPVAAPLEDSPYANFLIPVYDKNQIAVLRYTPSPASES